MIEQFFINLLGIDLAEGIAISLFILLLVGIFGAFLYVIKKIMN